MSKVIKKNQSKTKIKNSRAASVSGPPASRNLKKVPLTNEQKYLAILHYRHILPSLRKVAKLHGTTKSTLQRWNKELPTIKHTPPPKTIKELKNDIKTCIQVTLKNDPLTTIDTLTKIICKECGLHRSKRSINRYVKNLGYTYKNAFRYVNYKHDNAKVKEFCLSFKAANEGNVLISIDEAGFYIGDHRRKGWSLKGKRLSIKGNNTLQRTKFTIIVAIHKDGIIDCIVLDHNCKKKDFVDFITHLKAPEGAVLLMDNLRCHHSYETLEAADLKGYDIIYTPCYSPRTNPIENVFGAIKPEYRKQCPLAFKEQKVYKDIFASVINGYEHRDLTSFFDHTMQFINDTIQGIENDPEGFIFIGYDI